MGTHDSGRGLGGRNPRQYLPGSRRERQAQTDGPSVIFSATLRPLSKPGCKPLGAKSVTDNVQAEIRVGSIPTLDSVSKRYDTVKMSICPTTAG